MVLQADGKIVVAGKAFEPTTGDEKFALARYIGDPVLAVVIDIKPGSDPNSINTKSKGKIPVAILSDTTFSAPTEVDSSSLTFGSVGDEPSLSHCNISGEDVNGDQILDLVCHFLTQLTGFQPGDTLGTLAGETTSGASITDTDSVRIKH